MIYLVNMCRYTHVLKADWTGEGEGVWSVGHVVHMVIKIKIKIKKKPSATTVCMSTVCMYVWRGGTGLEYIHTLLESARRRKNSCAASAKSVKNAGSCGSKKKKKNWGCVRPFSSETCCFRRKSCFESLFLCL